MIMIITLEFLEVYVFIRDSETLMDNHTAEVLFIPRIFFACVLRH